MDAKRTVFRFQCRYILLEDLEELYSEGQIESEDEIEIAQCREGFFFRFPIRALIDLYGSEHPFRGQRNEGVETGQSTSDPSVDVQNTCPYDPSVDPGTENEVFPLPAAAYRKKTEDGIEFVFMDFPLYNVNNEPEEDRITGEEVVKELRKLKSMLPLTLWTPADSTRFSFAGRTDNRTPICRLCNYTPRGQLPFFKHLFSEKHEKRLAEHMISQRSFEFWKKKIEGSGKGKKPKWMHPVRRILLSFFPKWTSFDRIPLLDPQVVDGGKTMDPLRMESLRFFQEHLVKNNHKLLDTKSTFLGEFFAFLPEIPTSCGFCNTMFSKTSKYEIVEHIISDTHLEAVKKLTINPAEIHFWTTILKIEVVLKMKYNKTLKIFVNHNDPPLPLVDFHLSDVDVDGSTSTQTLEDLRNIWNNIPKREFDEKGYITGIEWNPNVKCAACGLPPGFFSTKSKLVDHIFTEKHLKHLITFGFSEKAVRKWKIVFAGFSKQLENGTNSEFSQANRLNESEENRVPLLLASTKNVILCEQAVYISTYKTLKSLFEEGGEELQRNAMDRKVDWKCEFCSTNTKPVLFSNEFEVLKHILQQNHKEKMKFKAAKNDLDYWKQRIIELSGIPEDPKKRSEEKNHRESQQKGQEKQVNPAEKPAESRKKVDSQAFRNNPRVPLLDFLPPNVRIVDQKTFRKSMGLIRNAFEGWKVEIVELAKAEKVDWKCALCAKGSFKNKWEALKHILTKKHQDSMMPLVNDEDLQYWKKWVAEMKRVHEKNNLKKQAELRNSKTNDPRIPLLDVPSKFNCLIAQKSCKDQYNVIRRRLATVKPSPDLMKPTDCQCLHCPNAQRFSSLWTVFLHVFNESHLKNLLYMTSAEDFEYWQKLISPQPEEILSPQRKGISQEVVVPVGPPSPIPPIAAVQEKEPTEFCAPLVDTPADSRQPPAVPADVAVVPRIVPKPCSLPLFRLHSQMPYSPPLSLFMFANAYKKCSTEGPYPFLSEPTHCQFCQVDMTSWTLLRVTNHALSMSHLQKLYERNSGSHAQAQRSDFQYWIEQLEILHGNRLKKFDFDDYGNEKLQQCVVFPVPKPNNASPVFTGFTTGEQKLINNFDVAALVPLEKCRLMARHAMCLECDVWIFSIESLFSHYLSAEHFENIRKSGRPVRMSDVEHFMIQVRKNQKSLFDRCVLM